MKADEWKHQTFVYSMLSLQGIMSQQDLNMCCLSVNTYHILCMRVITLNEIDKAHTLLSMFCDQFQRKCGCQNCVPNMHISLLLKNYIKDYGSVYEFWCFGFGRFDGILGKFHTNRNDISLQGMRKLVSGSQLRYDKIVYESVFREIESTTETCHDKYVLRQAEVVNGFNQNFHAKNVSHQVRQGVLTTDAFCDVEDLFKHFYGCSFVCVSRK